MPSVVTPTLTKKYAQPGALVFAYGTLAIGAGDYTVGGLALSLASLVSSSKNPLDVQVQGLSGYVYEYDRTNKKIKIRQASASGSQIYTFVVPNAKGADAAVANSDTTDQASGCTNDDYIDTFAAIAAGAWTYGENAEIDVARNVVISFYNDSGGPLNLVEGTISFAITGLFRGAAQTDTIVFTSTSGNKAIANTKFRWKAGVKPFELITSVVATGLTTDQNGIKIGIGLGRLLGYPVDGKAGTSADFLKASVAGANVAIAAVSTTNKTVDLGAVADGNAIEIQYTIDAPASGAALSELLAAATPAAVVADTITFASVHTKV